MYEGFSIAVVMPIHNEADHLERAISMVPAFVDLIIAIDDASTDRSSARLAGIKDPRLKVLEHSVNRGVGAATKSGYSYALQAGADLIAVMDGDGQMDGRDLHRLLDRAIEGADYVKGNRFLHRESIGSMPIERFAGNIVLSVLMRFALRFSDPLDAQCGYTVIRRNALERIPFHLLYDRYGFPNEMLSAVCRHGFRVDNVPVRTIYAGESSGIKPLVAIPTILGLIARSFIRTRISSVPEAVGAVRLAQNESTD